MINKEKMMQVINKSSCSEKDKKQAELYLDIVEEQRAKAEEASANAKAIVYKEVLELLLSKMRWYT